ncbi:zinc finger protein 862-like [Paramisgurnus dabryanus]|uniref:zinc finger protein 862-like n=1 Tax=Paramisgurnus dabryanus TaxID=90735 RepID=UPI003CCFDEFE
MARESVVDETGTSVVTERPAIRPASEVAQEDTTATDNPRHRKSGWNPQWLDMPQFKSWLYLTKHGMFCRMCRQHKPTAKKGPAQRTFIEVGALVFRKDYLERHIASEPHKQSIEKQISLASGYSVVQAFEPNIIVEHEAIIGGFKCLYWLVKNEIAHHTNYPKLLSLAELLGCDYFKKLKVDQKNNYRSHRIIDEMLEILAMVIEEPLLKDIKSSQAISLEIDETTDVSVNRQLDIHIRYLDKEGRVFNQFLDMVSVYDGKADTIVAAVKDAIQKKELPVDRLYGIGTDGAAVMTGKVNGVAKQLADSFPKLVSVACAAHRLALACKDSSNEVKYMGTFRDHLQDLHLYFHNSANRTAKLKSVASVLGISDLKIKAVKDVRWLSQHLAIQNLQKNLPAADVLPHLARLSKVFQKTDVNFLHIKEQVPITITVLKGIMEASDTPPTGSFLSRFYQDLDDPDVLGSFSITHEEERSRRGCKEQGRREEMWTRFLRDVLQPYITSLISNLESRFVNLHILGAFSVLGPQAPTLDDTVNIAHLQTLTRKFLPGQDATVVQEWMSFKGHVLLGAFKDKSQGAIMEKLASEFDEWADIYPCLSQLAAVALVIPV